RIYSLDGSITDGFLESLNSATASGVQNAGKYDDLMTIAVDKPAQIYAGQDVLNLVFVGENIHQDDVTRIVAGRDIKDSPDIATFNIGATLPSLLIGGPGTFDIEAGRNIGPLSPSSTDDITGIVAIGNVDNPYLPHESADLEVLFGVGKGIDNQAFV